MMSDQIADDTTSEEETQHPVVPTTEEERAGSIPGSAEATAVAVSLSTPHGNPVVDRYHQVRRRTKKKKKSKPATQDQATQTEKK